MNAKISKELRRYAREMRDPARPVSMLMSKPVRLKDGGTASVAINHSASERGIYIELKAQVERHPEILETLRAASSYRRMLEHEQKSRHDPSKVFDVADGPPSEQTP